MTDQPVNSLPAQADAYPAPAPGTDSGFGHAPSPVQPVTVVRSHRRGLRWLVAAAIVVLVAASASAAFFIVAGAASPSTVARWAPADTIVYLEARFDLPGDQHANAGRFLAAFPGFADPASLDAKLAEIYDKAIGAASNGKRDYSTDIKPWFGGQVGVALSALPSGGSLPGARSTSPRGAFVLTVTDPAKAGAWLATAADGKGTSATYGGVALIVFGSGDRSAAVGVDGSVMIGGDVATVHAIIDADGAAGLAATADFKKALSSTPKDRVGFIFVESRKFIQAETALLPAGTDPYPAGLLDKVPTWVAMTTLFEADSLVLDAVAPAVAGGAAPANHVSTLATHLPATTVAAFEAHDLGSAIKASVEAYQNIPASKDGIGQVLKALDGVGGIDSFITWLGDSAVAVTIDGTNVGGGIVIALADKTAAEAASARFAALKNLVSLAGLPGAKVTTAAHGDTTITTIDLGSLDDLKGLAPGVSSGLGGSKIPASVSGAHIALSYAVTDQLAIVGIGGDDFVTAVLDTTAGTSLAAQPTYKTAIGLAGASNSGQGYVDLQAIVRAIEARLPADARTAFGRDTKPYLSPFSAIAFSLAGGDLNRARVVVTVAK